MKTIKDWIEILEEHKICPVCGSENTIPVITPYPYEYKTDWLREANSKRGIIICCNDCGALASITAKELESEGIE